jgi:dephospho-CoA kinase
MVIGIIGENCSGKSTLANQVRDALGAEIITGKDYLRMAKSESEARKQFQDKLKSAVNGSHVIYVISEPEHIALLPEGAVRILVTADLETIKARFKARMRGSLPAPVEKMIDSRHGRFDSGAYDYRFDGANGDAAALCGQLKRALFSDEESEETP